MKVDTNDLISVWNKFTKYDESGKGKANIKNPELKQADKKAIIVLLQTLRGEAPKSFKTSVDAQKLNEIRFALVDVEKSNKYEGQDNKIVKFIKRLGDFLHLRVSSDQVNKEFEKTLKFLKDHGFNELPFVEAKPAKLPVDGVKGKGITNMQQARPHINLRDQKGKVHGKSGKVGAEKAQRKIVDAPLDRETLQFIADRAVASGKMTKAQAAEFVRSPGKATIRVI